MCSVANGNLKMLDARMIAQEMLYAKQRIFEYRDKPGKQLARVLSDSPTGRSILALKNQNGEMMSYNSIE